MTCSINDFINKYSDAITEGNAGVFAGAGLSCSSGYVNWKELLREIAEEINLNIDKESDLIAVAQFYKNEKCGNHNISQLILNQFTKKARPNHNLELITRLPISVYWTTNYDTLIEENIKKNNRKVDVKIAQPSLALNVKNRDAVVYKMHGDISNPSEAVITKDDYESYNHKRPLFITSLQGDLISRTFLFIGFSFEDPNLESILGRLKVLLGENLRTHYCFLKKIFETDFENHDDYAYAKIKQELRINDLKRYQIEAVLLENYNQISEILTSIELKLKKSRIFISGSAEEFEYWSSEQAIKFMYSLSKSLIKNDYKIISGFGVGVGSTIINGALDGIAKCKYNHIDEYLVLRPFPQISFGDLPLSELWAKYRKNMIEMSRISIFIFGNKKNNGDIVIADGVLKEFEISKELGNYIIPIGSTGYAAKFILDTLKNNISEYPYLMPYLDLLENEKDINKIVSMVLNIISDIKKL